jgi:hypothetical protein
LALEQNVPQEAIELLETNGLYELAVPSVDFYQDGIDLVANSFFGGLYRVYVRGTVYWNCDRQPRPQPSSRRF